MWQGNEPVGLIDWDEAGPHLPMYDVAYALQYSVPFRDDEECLRWLAYSATPDRARRIEVFAEAYGLSSTTGLYDAVVDVQQQQVDNERHLAERGDARAIEWIADGWLEQGQARLQWTRDHRHLFER